MPEQTSRRGNVITGSAFEAPFDTQILRAGINGLNLKDSLDALEGWARHTNVDHDNTGEATSRPGQTALATAGTHHHAVRKLRDPQAGTFTRIWGIDTSLYLGASGALAQIDTGYSGDPLTLLPHRPTLSGDPWMFVADRSRMRKVRADGLDLPIGLPAPGAAVTTALSTEYRRDICTFQADDPVGASDAAQWTGTAGADENGNPAAPPLRSDIVGKVGTAVYFTTQVGNAESTYDSWWGLARTLDLTQLDPVGGGGMIAASDDDYLHLWMLFSHPHLLEEFRVYFIVSPVFDPTVLPGTSSLANFDSYVKAFRPSDFTQFIFRAQSAIDTSETERIRRLREAFLSSEGNIFQKRRDAIQRIRELYDPARRPSIAIGGSTHTWVEQGALGVPLRRGDFQRIGNTEGRDWATVTGILLYIRTRQTPTDQIAAVGVDDLYLTGGKDPDTGEPGAQPYDYRITHYDPRTGAESNGSPEQAEATFIDSLRRGIVVTPAAAFGDAAVRQRVYRRGGSFIDDWGFVGATASDGGAFIDEESDASVAAAGTLPIDHFQPVPTVDDTGATVLAQPVPALWGPIEGILFACGDPYRPGHLYWSNADAPDHWASGSNVEVCPPSEELMHGGIAGHQGFVFSRQRLYFTYPSLTTSGSVTATPSLCKRGLFGRWAFAVGPGGIYFGAEDGIFLTAGGPEEWISRDIDPLFQGKTVHGYLPIDKLAPSAWRMTIWENKLYFQYQDTGGERQTLVYSILNKFWRHYEFGRAISGLQGDDEDVLLLGALNLGSSYTHDGTSDAGLAIAATLRTGALSGGTREEKLFGDQIIDADRDGATIDVQNFLNEETIANATTALTDGSGRERYINDAFGEKPQQAHSISTELRWASTTARPTLYQIGYAITRQPDLTNKRVTNWDDLGHPDEKWLTGVTFDVDTGGVDRTILIERDFAGARTTVATLTVNAAGRHKRTYSWLAVPAQMVRVRPNDDCRFWLLFRADWIWQPEPPRISKWDVHFENAWDQYYTGLDLYCDTVGVEKRIEVWVDEVRLTNSLGGGLTYWPVTANGRRVVHLTLPWGRGHVFRFLAVDDHPGLLYSHRWHLEEEPSEQANWNQNFSIYGTRADKWLKAIVFECDTFDQIKTVGVEVDGTTVETLAVRANGRRVVQIALSVQQLGRVWRMFPVDGNPGRLYTAQPIFDEEPFQLDRWETQETNHGLPGWFFLTYGHLVLKATHDVTLTVRLQINQRGVTRTFTYTIPATGGEKIRHYQTFEAAKGVLVRYILTSQEPFYLYREETTVFVQPWGAGEPIAVQPFGSDDLDPTRPMRQATYAALAPGGALGPQGAGRPPG